VITLRNLEADDYVDELAVELFFPADDPSDAILRNALPPRAG
jgi:hypothetical protein